MKNGSFLKVSFCLTLSVFLTVKDIRADMRSKIEIQGHRGARGIAPENTIPGFQIAMESGAEGLELDLAMTSDGHLVVSHDPFVNRDVCLYPNGKPISDLIRIRSLTLEQVQEFDCGTIKNPLFPHQIPIKGARIPSLQEVFKLVEKSNIFLSLEIKTYEAYPEWTATPQEVVSEMVRMIHANSLEKRVRILSFDSRVFPLLKEQNLKSPKALLLEDGNFRMLSARHDVPGIEGRAELGMIALAQKFEVDILSPNYKLLNQERVKAIQAAGFKVITWTVNHGDWESVARMDVDGIITDYPGELIQFLKTSSHFGPK
jgi:glycerophosphoryl diester phosphodiesterase